jgi:hypothetical protein
MGLILSEPIKKVVEIPQILAKTSVEDAKNHPKRPYRPRTSPGRKGRGEKKHRPFFRRKKRFSEKVLCFCLPLDSSTWLLGHFQSRCVLRRCFSGCVSGPVLGHVFCACAERESAEMATEITDKHGNRKIRVHPGPVLCSERE